MSAEEYRIRDAISQAYGQAQADSQQVADIQWLLQRIDAVLTLHKPVTMRVGQLPQGVRIMRVCAGCWKVDGQPHAWPCPTVRAVGMEDE